jgi:xanthine dehydrogenase small subunit
MEDTINIILNDHLQEISISPATTLLDYLRQFADLPGTKEGCGEGECGACTVLVGELTNDSVVYKAVASCLFPLGDTDGKHIVSIEGLNQASLNPFQQAMVDEGASQCGYCTPGFIISITSYLLSSPQLDAETAMTALDGNICRCTGYASIKRSIEQVLKNHAGRLLSGTDRLAAAVESGLIPDYFLNIRQQLKKIQKPPELLSARASEKVIHIGGGTDLYVQQGDDLKQQNIRFLSQDESLKRFEEKNNHLLIGAGITMETIRTSPIFANHLPEIGESMKWVSSTLVRNRATLAGNIVNASPIGDLSIMFLVLNGVLTIRKGEQHREVPLSRFFQTYKKIDLEPGELVEHIQIDLPRDNERFSFERISQRAHFDIATCNSALWIKVEDGIISEARISAGGVSPIPLLAAQTADFLRGKRISPEVIQEAAAVLANEIAPISDVRGSAEYKKQLMQHLLFAHFLKLFPQQVMFEEVV